MLNRRHIRIKVMQQLYALQHSKDATLKSAEKELNKSMNRLYDLYLLILLLLVELKRMEEGRMEQAKSKYLPSAEDSNPLLKFVQNPLLEQLANHVEVQKKAQYTGINWADYQDLIRNLLKEIKASDVYQAYMQAEEDMPYKKERKFIVAIFEEFIAPNESLHALYEEFNMYWVDDMPLANSMVMRTLQSYKESHNATATLLPLFKDSADQLFAIDLLRKTMLNGDDYNVWISDKAKNWKMERIAQLDLVCMQMALCEFTEFDSIPVKVSLNEYIELSKEYSTPGSKTFVNGVLDKIIRDLKEQKKIKKMGRGLIE